MNIFKKIGLGATGILLAFGLIAAPITIKVSSHSVTLESSINTAQAVYVHGYTRSNGTYVSGYYRSAPDGNPYNNYSYPGNTNPYTGKVAGGNPSTYLNNYYGGGSSSYSLPSYSYSYPSYSYSTPSYSYTGGSSYSTFDLDYTSPTKPQNYWVYDDSKMIAGASQLSGYYTDPTPYFKFSPSTDNKAVKGYYVLWSKNTDGDPIEKGKFTKKPEFKAPKLARTGVYYLLISAVDKAGNSSDMVYATYQYWQQ